MIRNRAPQCAWLSGLLVFGSSLTPNFVCGQDAPLLEGPELFSPRLALREKLADSVPASLADPATAQPAADAAVDNPLYDERDLEGSAAAAAAPSSPPAQESAAESAETPDEAKPALTAAQAALAAKIQRCLEIYHRPERANDQSPWSIMHAMLPYGAEAEVIANGRTYNSIGYVCWNGICKGQNLFYTSGGQLAARQGPGVQGHHGQFLAMLAQARINPSYGMRVDGREFTLHDLIEYEQRTCVPRSELTFKLIALSWYLDTDATWRNQHGEWSIPRLIQEELAQPIVGAACGGTHRLMGLSYAVRRREVKEGPIDGQWLRAKAFLDAYHDYTLSLQNRDGSFSTKWFEGRADFGDEQRRLETTGHILEWLSFSLPEERLHEEAVHRAVNFLADLLLSDPRRDWKIGPRSHGLHALAIYQRRAFAPSALNAAGELAEQSRSLDARTKR